MENMTITPALHTELVNKAKEICLISGKTTMPEFNKNLNKLIVKEGYSVKSYFSKVKAFL